MSAATAHKPIVHFVGSIPLPDAETVFRTLSAATGPHLKRLPDGETGIRKTWILNTPADKHRSGAEAVQKPASQFIVAPRAQASRRCENTSDAKRHAAKLC